jgi:hypothetical protein
MEAERHAAKATAAGPARPGRADAIVVVGTLTTEEGVTTKGTIAPLPIRADA